MTYFLLDNPNRRYKQYREVRRNKATLSGAIILHSAENLSDLIDADSGAEAVARYISTRSTPGSYHVLTDRDSVVQMAPYEYEVWHDTASNNFSIGISVAWSKKDLAGMGEDNRNAYYLLLAHETLRAAKWLKKERGIEVPLDRMRSREEIMARKPGISTHSRMDPSRRSDPFGTDSVYEREFLAVLHRLSEPAPPADVPPPLTNEPASGWPYTQLPVTREHTAASHQAWVNLMAAVGYKDLSLTKNIQQWLRDRRDPSGRRYYIGTVDGEFGPYTIDALQRFLRDKGLYDGKLDAFTAPYHEARGSRMIGAEITYLNQQAQYLI